MQSYRHPDPSYTPDFGNSYISSARTRFWIGVWEFFSFLATGVMMSVLILVCAVVAAVLNPHYMMSILFAGFICGVVLGPLLKIGTSNRVPLRCSRCRRRMQRDEQRPGGTSVIFYVCPHCRVYVDSGRADE